MTVNMIALSGHAHSGKDTVAQLIRTELIDRHVASVSFATRLKDLCMKLYGLTNDDLYTEAGKDRASSLQYLKCPRCEFTECTEPQDDGIAVCDTCMTAGDRRDFEAWWTNREIMQNVGDALRKVDPRVFVRPALKAADDYLSYGAGLVVITDCRFLSEFHAVKSRNCATWRVKRERADKHVMNHVSETEMDFVQDSEFSHVLFNDGTREYLRLQVRAGLGKLGLVDT